MIRNILAVIAGNLGWTALWLGSNAFLKIKGLLPSDPTKRIDDGPALLILLASSIVFSIVAGYLAAAISTSAYWPVLVLCVIQLAMGVFFQMQSWKLMPVWYHLSFLTLLAPATLWGAWLRLR